jgi:hypothetical protein
MVKNEPAKDAAPTNGSHGRGRFFPTKPSSDPLDFAAHLITGPIPGRVGKVVATGVVILVLLVGAAVAVLEILSP